MKVPTHTACATQLHMVMLATVGLDESLVRKGEAQHRTQHRTHHPLCHVVGNHGRALSAPGSCQVPFSALASLCMARLCETKDAACGACVMAAPQQGFEQHRLSLHGPHTHTLNPRGFWSLIAVACTCIVRFVTLTYALIVFRPNVEQQSTHAIKGTRKLRPTHQ